MAKQAAFGAKLSFDIATVLTKMGQIMDLQGPEIEVDTVDVTTHDSPGQWEEHVGTIKRSGTITMEIVLDASDTVQAAFFGLLGVITDMEVEFPLTPPVKIAFSGIPTGWSPSQAHDGAILGSLSVKPTGIIPFPAV